jgi:hypothetical protein
MSEGLRERIKSAAEANNRSMNAEIVATLEEAYPVPRMPNLSSDLELVYFQWHGGEWKSVDADSWERFRFDEAPQHIIDRMTEGRNFFVVAVIDREIGLCNLISHAYKLDGRRAISIAEDYLSEEEKEEYSRIWHQPSMTPHDEQRLQFLREKMEPAFKLPPEAILLLQERLKRIASEEVIERLLKRIS